MAHPDDQRLAMDFLGLKDMHDKSGPDDDRDDGTRLRNNRREVERVLLFWHYLELNHRASARKHAEKCDWSKETVADALNWWYLN